MHPRKAKGTTPTAHPMRISCGMEGVSVNAIKLHVVCGRIDVALEALTSVRLKVVAAASVRLEPDLTVRG